jgi:hypothetical protein
MKKKITFLGLIICILITSCETSTYKEVNGHKVEIIDLNSFKKMRYVEFDGHEYVEFSNGHRGSMCHSPKCPCLKEYKK